MAEKIIPITLYSIRSSKPTTTFGAVANVPLMLNVQRALGRMSFVGIPPEATITKAEVWMWLNTVETGGIQVSAQPPTVAWRPSVTWNNQPAVGASVGSRTLTAPVPLTTKIVIDVTTWAQTRPTNGLRFTSTTPDSFGVAGSIASTNQPVLVVTYSSLPAVPGNLTPQGGAVSVAKPTLTFAGDPTMTDMQVEIDVGGVVWNSGWTPGTTGYFPQPAGAPTPAEFATVKWRVKVRNTSGESAFSPWVSYTWDALPAASISAPASTSPDGSPTLVWTSTGQVAYKAELWEGDTLIDSTNGWIQNATDRAWTPQKGVDVPNHTGRFDLYIRDGVVRVAAAGAPTEQIRNTSFTTTLTGSGAGMDTLDAVYDEPIVVLTGSRAVGIPDQISLLRDGVQVPIWNAAGEAGMVMPGSDFFTGNNFTVRDLTANPKATHTWQVIAWSNGVPSATNPSKTLKLFTKNIWLVNPRTNEKVVVYGHNALPDVDSTVTESAVVHTPISGGGLVEPIRRRLMRTTKQGQVNGTLHNSDEAIMDRWVEGSSADKYRLVYGKKNLSVIFGDYNPQDISAYPDSCGPDRVQFTVNWWQRLRDF